MGNASLFLPTDSHNLTADALSAGLSVANQWASVFDGFSLAGQAFLAVSHWLESKIKDKYSIYLCKVYMNALKTMNQ